MKRTVSTATKHSFTLKPLMFNAGCIVSAVQQSPAELRNRVLADAFTGGGPGSEAQRMCLDEKYKFT